MFLEILHNLLRNFYLFIFYYEHYFNRTPLCDCFCNSDKIIAWLKTNIPWRLNLRTTFTFWQHKHSFSVFIVEQFLHLHQTLGSQSSLSNMSRSIASPSSKLSWNNPLWLDMLLSGSNWKPITLFSKLTFTLIKKNERDLLLGNTEYTRDEDFLEGLWRKLFSTRPISCYYFNFICLLSWP